MVTSEEFLSAFEEAPTRYFPNVIHLLCEAFKERVGMGRKVDRERNKDNFLLLYFNLDVQGTDF